MTLITFAQRQKLLENGRAQRDVLDRQDQALDFEPHWNPIHASSRPGSCVRQNLIRRADRCDYWLVGVSGRWSDT
jgi:hypothetical protein